MVVFSFHSTTPVDWKIDQEAWMTLIFFVSFLIWAGTIGKHDVLNWEDLIKMGD